MVKALTDSGARYSIISEETTKGIKIRSKTEIKRWKTSDGRLTTSSKTKNSHI